MYSVSLESLLGYLLSPKLRSQKFIVLCPDEAKAQHAFEILSQLEGEKKVAYLPGYFAAGVHRYESPRAVIARRLHLAFDLEVRGLRPRIFVTTFAGLTRKFPPFSWIKKHTFPLACGDSVDMDDLLDQMKNWAYTPVSKVEAVGECAVRGHLLDFWSPQEKYPVRVQFDGDVIGKMRFFHPLTQRSLDIEQSTVDKKNAVLNRTDLIPCREFVWPKDPDAAAEKLNHALLNQKISGEFRVNYLEEFQAQIPFPGVDDANVFFTETPDSTFYQELAKTYHNLSVESVFPRNELVAAQESIEKLYDKSFDSAQSRNQISVRKETVFPDLNKVLGVVHFIQESDYLLPDLSLIADFNKKKSKEKIQLLKEIYDENDFSLLFLLNSKESFYDFSLIVGSVFSEVHDQKTDTLKNFRLEDHEDPKTNKKISVAIANISGNFFIPQSQTLVCSENALRGIHHDHSIEVFDEEVPAQTQSSNIQAFLSTQVADFQEGDFVVHIQYGIAIYRGLVSVTLMDVKGDFLLLEFAGADKIYVPVSKMSLVQKYIGAKDTVKLDSLSGTQWQKRKERAQKDIEKIAKELMDHQAKRAITPGHAFSKIDGDYLAFADAFPFDETADQINSINEIMKDMGQPKAMDRLLCGDVGFGKTEVAMRAAYRCILDGKQVAWLVPTTVLAHQHARSLQERFADFGVEIALLDRSVGKAGQTILKNVNEGKIDILVGTHRILSKDLSFRDLGLLIVDEEHRFGVHQKEKIKSMSYGIDILTMTATPIPRTLQMAMVGLRSLSLLTTPPKTRLATKTFLSPFDDEVVTQAITFEIQRGGQAFYVHNRVEELQQVYSYLTQLLPNLKIAMGHGQMSQGELEKIILDFLDGRYQLLLCTTIIESGIDMPNVNTILVQNAEHFGLAQLYQLRGRVGRRASQGYAYFLTNGKLNENSLAYQRLSVLRDHQALGSGFIVASHDMELRGSGSLVGDEQSGRVNEIGLETYLSMLDDSIKELGGQKVRATQDVTLDFPLSLSVPESYIPEDQERLRLYRRFFSSATEEHLSQLLVECQDRFGSLPQEIQYLAEVARIRRQLIYIGAVSLNVLEKLTELKMDPEILQSDEGQDVIQRILEVCNLRVKNVRLTPEGKVLLPVTKKDFQHSPVQAFQELKRILALFQGRGS